MKKKVLALLLCATMVMGLAACGSKEVSSEVPAEETGVEENAEGVEGTTIKLSSWHLTDDAAKAAFEGWNALNTGVTVENEVLDYDAYIQNLKIELASGGGPDVFVLQAGSLLTEFGEYVVDVSGRAADAWGDDWETQFLPLYMEMVKDTEGNLVGLPIGSGTGVAFMWTDTDTLAKYGVTEAPRTYDELKAACEKVRAAGGVATVSDVNQSWAAIDLFMNIAGDVNQEKMYAAIEGEADWTDPDMVQAFDIYQKCFTEGIFADGQMGGIDKKLYFGQERTSPFCLEGSWINANIQLNDFYDVAIENGAVYDICTIDWNGDGKAAPVTNTVEAVLCINKNSDNVDAAWQFVEYFAIEGIEAIINDTMLTFPSTVDFELTNSSFKPAAAEAFNIVTEKMSDGTAGYREIAYADLKQEICDQIELLALSETTPEAAAAAVQAVSEAQER